jgi:hypothetical protein
MTISSLLERVTTPIAWLPMVVAMIVGPLFVFWAVEPTPLRIVYAAPMFTDTEVDSREDAERHAVLAVAGGTQVYRYIEFCVSRPFSGTAHRSWVNTAMIWHAPDVPTQLSREPGCRSANVMLDVPLSNPTRTFWYVHAIDVPVNPMRTDTVDMPPIPLTILAAESRKP